ncbi:MAG: PQQ-binding-like beta-propeller repeat protein [Armatimonadetes bacterium]|nr:PQQ-binding-like beta-propeller repeat protein [Armatimonadota bacterium]
MILLGIVFLAFGLSAVSAAEAPLLPLDTAEGVRATMTPRGVTSKIEVVTGEGNTTDGKGALHLEGTSPTAQGNKYFGVRIPLKEPVDLRERRILIDARTNFPVETRAFYVRLYNRGEKQPAWSFASWSGQLRKEWRTFSIQVGFSPDGLDWEASVVENRVASHIDAIELIIGTSEDEKTVDLLCDNIRVAERIQTIQDLKAPKPLVRETVLVRDGKPVATIIHPESQAGRKAAQAISDAVKAQTGVALPLRAATLADREREAAETQVLLGNVDTNPALLLPYARYQTPVDSVCPGPGGYLVHTIHDPYGKGTNLVVVGATDDAGLERAAATFAGIIAKQAKGQALVLPRLFERGYSDEFLKRFAWASSKPDPKRLEQGLAEGRRALETGRHTSVAGVLANVANRYRFTGHSVEAKLFVALWDLYGESAVADPRKFGGPWGFDSDFPSVLVVSGWDTIEEDPALTDEERLRVTKIMARWLTEAVIPSVGTSAHHVPHNHQTFPGLGALMAGLYFSNGYNVLEGPRWLAIADNLFRPQAERFKPHEDCNGYQWLTNGHQMRYALARPYFALFTNGSGQKVIDYCIGTMDNLGYQVPYGDTGSWQCWTSELVCLDMFAYATGDPAATWVANHKRQLRNLMETHAFYRPDKGERPTRFDGVRVWPLEPMYYHSFKAEERPPLERCFDKVSFREALDPKAAYLLLDGLSNGGHKHLDGNSIPRLTQHERIWLADNDYFKAQTKYHNTALVFKEGQGTPIPDYIELVGASETKRYGYSRSRASGYSGVDWDRAIVWVKEHKAFLVLDRMTAREVGEYQLRVLWHGVGEVVPAADGMLLRQQGPSLRIQMAPGPRVSIKDDPELGTNWRGYPYAEPVVRSMTATATVRLKAGESYLFATALHSNPAGDTVPWRMVHLAGTDAVRVSTGKEVFVVGMGPAKALPTADLSTDAHVWAMDQHGVTVLDATRAALGKTTLHASKARASADQPARVAPQLVRIPSRPAVPNLQAGGQAPAHPVVWAVRPAPERLILSGNMNRPGAVNLGVKLTVDPEPAKANVFSPTGPNRAEALLDGDAQNSTATSVMWDPDQKVTATLDLGAPCLVERVHWAQWWATTSSKKTSYLPEQTVVFLSNDNFQADVRRVGVVTDAGPHPNFGTPINYAVDAGKAPARYVRIEFTPKAGSAIYLSEIVVEGRPTAEGVDAVPYEFTRIVTAKMGNGAPDGLFAATGQGGLLALNADGSTRWTVSYPCKLNDVAAADLDGDGRDEAIIARSDHHVTAVDDAGKELWSKQLPYYRRNPIVGVVLTGDLDGDGKPEVIAGADNWRYYAFKADGTELWNYESVHRSTAGAVADLDGDGKDEVLCGTEYYWTSTLRGDGLQWWRYNFGPFCYDIATGSFDGDKTRGVVYGGGDGHIHYVSFDGKLRMKFQTGEEVREVATGDLDGDGRDEILAGSLSNNVYCFGADAKLRWRRDLGSAITALTVVKGLVVVGTDAGQLYTLDKDGKPVAVSELKSRVIEAVPYGDGMAVVTADGRVRQLRATR